MKPLIGFVSWNRMGFTVQNLELLLNTKEDFDLVIVDNGSQDDTQDYLKSLKDSRIKDIKLLDENYGLIYGLNYCISKREKGQPFLNIDADVSIHTDNFIENCEKVVKEFPEVGIVGNVRPTYFQEKKEKYNEITRNGVRFQKTSFVLGCMMYFPSETLDLIGYFNEENHLADIDISHRLNLMNKWVGYCPDNLVYYKEPSCNDCNHKGICSNPNLVKNKPYCFEVYYKNYGHRDIYMKNIKNLNLTNYSKESVYCASVHDVESQKIAPYDLNRAKENFNFFKKRTK